jgi:methionyl-tRNA formyltransferase
MELKRAYTPEELSAVLAGKSGFTVFCPDWSWIIPEDMLRQHQFIGFHAAPLPAYRGGSPIQHQILDGVRRTRLTAFKMTSELDAGDILLQREMSLQGTLRDIWKRIAKLVGPMCLDILERRYQTTPQAATLEPVLKRRKPEESRIPEGLPTAKLLDFVRMLDMDGYPRAFVEKDGERYEFSVKRSGG